MLTAQDDFIGHQLPTTFDHVGTSDPAWMERMWYTGHPVPAGDIIFDIGLGYYPNKNVMDAFAGVTIDNVQHNIRMSRRLRPDPLLTRVGPLQIHVLEGLRRHRIVLAENDSGMSFDIEFHATLNPHEEEPHFRRRHGRVAEQIARAQQVGRYSGWIKAGGKRYELKPETWWGQRDRSWGIRAELHTDETKPPLSYFPPLLFSWSTIQFADHGLQWYFNERAPGDFIYITGEEVLPLGQQADRRRRITDVAHEITWADDPLGQTHGPRRIRDDVRGRRQTSRADQDAARTLLPEVRDVRRAARMGAGRRQGAAPRRARPLGPARPGDSPSRAHAERSRDRSARRELGRLRRDGVRRLVRLSEIQVDTESPDLLRRGVGNLALR